MRSLLGLLGILLPLCLLGTNSYAADGDLDSSFATAGTVTTDLGGYDKAQSLALQSDGSILLAGSSKTGGDSDFALVRYTGSGNLDPGFGSGGIVTTDIASLDDGGYSVALQADGKILVAGYSEVNYQARFALVRYTSSGSLDPTFGTLGMVTTDIGGFDEYGQSVAVQADGRILVAGYSDNGSDNDFALVRYTGSGSLDGNFGSGGIVTTDFSASDDVARSVALDADGRILVAGYSSLGGSNAMALARYNSDGSLDSSFGSGGIVTSNLGSGDNAYSVAIQPEADGKILIGGYSYLGNYAQVALLRYNSDGSLDSSFGSGGIVITDVGGYNDYALSITIQPDGRILVGGYSDNGSKNDMALLRYNSDGSLDASFAGNGIVTTDVGGLNDGAYSVALQPDGKILLAGYSNNGGNFDFALLRFQGSLLTPYSVTPVVGANGSLNPATPQQVYAGNRTSFSVSAAPGYQLESISGCGGSLSGNLYTTAPVTADCSVTASFRAISHPLSIDVSGQGIVHSAPPPDILCSGSCSQDYAENTQVTLSAVPAVDFTFTGWGGDCSGSGNCQLSIDTAKSVTASFSDNIPNPVLLASSQSSYLSIQSAYDSIPTGQSERIKIKAGEQTPEQLLFDRQVTVSLEGGYNNIFSAVTGSTAFAGSLTLAGGPVTVSELIIK